MFGVAIKFTLKKNDTTLKIDSQQILLKKKPCTTLNVWHVSAVMEDDKY